VETGVDECVLPAQVRIEAILVMRAVIFDDQLAVGVVQVHSCEESSRPVAELGLDQRTRKPAFDELYAQPRLHGGL